MAYVEPTTRTDGFVVSSSVWNQDVVDNMIAIRALAEVEPTVIAGIYDGTASLPASTWTTRPLSLTVRDPDGIVTAEDYGNYEFNLADGSYLIEIRATILVYQGGESATTRLRDVDNNETIIGTNDRTGIKASGMSSEHTPINNYTIGDFVLANGGDTTFQLQSFCSSGEFFGGASVDAGNNELNGNWQSVIKLWKWA